MVLVFRQLSAFVEAPTGTRHCRFSGEQNRPPYGEVGRQKGLSTSWPFPQSSYHVTNLSVFEIRGYIGPPSSPFGLAVFRVLMEGAGGAWRYNLVVLVGVVAPSLGKD